MTNEDPPRIVNCPKCKKPSAIGRPYSPFCSERCKLLDLGAWAKEEYRLKGEPLPDISTEDMDMGSDDTEKP